MTSIALTELQKKTVLEILKKHFRTEKYFIFGSRATQKNLKTYSDLDIAIQGKEVLSLNSIAKAREDFSSSDLPFKVDLIDLNNISEEFLISIRSDLIALQAP